MSPLIFFENRAQVNWARNHGDRTATLVALTAEAAQAFDEKAIAYTAACDVADLAPVHAMHKRFLSVLDTLTRDCEKWLRDHVEEFPKSGPGVISADFYRLQYVVGAVITRTWLMQKVAEHFKPDRIAVFKRAPDPWLERLYCEDYPWLTLVPLWANDRHLNLEWLSAPPPADRWTVRATDAMYDMLRAARNKVRNITSRFKNASPKATSPRSLLFLGDIHYDWTYVLPHLRDTTVHRLADFEALVPSATPAIDTDAMLSSLRQWEAQKKIDTRIPELQLDIYPALAPHLRRCVTANPVIARHIEALCQAVLDRLRPTYLCTVGMDDYASKRFAFHARSRGTATVCYQHGGLYGTHYAPGLDHTAPAYADFFLTYGTGICPSTDASLPRPPQVAFIPVGSARIDDLIGRAASPRSTAKPAKVLWISDVSTANTIGGTFQYDDVRRYRLETRGLAILAQSQGLDITFRYFRANRRQHGTPNYLQTARYRNVHLSDTGPVDAVLAASALVIADVHSNTSWNEVIALRRPFVLFCDTRYSELQEAFRQSLQKACHLCTSEDDFFNTLRAIAHDVAGWLRDYHIESNAYLKHYVVDQSDGRSAQRVAALLSQDVLKQKSVGGRT